MNTKVARKLRFTLVAGLAAWILAPAQPLAAQETAVVGDPAWPQHLAAWRADREHDLAAPDSWLTLVGLEWLKSGVNSVGTAADNSVVIHAQAPEHIGLFTVSGKTPATSLIQLLAPTGGFPAGLTIDGAPAREGPLRISDTKPSTIAWQSLTLVVLLRGGRYALRVKDANSPTRTNFHGLNWYPPNPHFRVIAHWLPYKPPHLERIPTVIGSTLDLPAPGVAEFELDGKTYRLEPVTEPEEPGVLFFILRDETSKTTTYQAARFLHTPLPPAGLDHSGPLILDFNRLENPPCAYTPYATCPLPPEQNRLPVAIEAGEMRYSH
jgi:uncharacterized protein (DUF1684 family)